MNSFLLDTLFTFTWRLSLYM